MQKSIGGIVPVMLTPFTDADRIDERGLHRLVEWYLGNGADTLFAVCQSSEMQRLTLAERVLLARRTLEFAGGRVPVIASGHVSERLEEQVRELQAMADTGVDALVLVTNRLDPSDAGFEAFRASLETIIAALPPETLVYSGHEYTAANGRFALTIEPGNAALISRCEAVAKARAAGRPTVPSLLSEELATNPFLRARLPEVKAAIGMSGASDAAAFAEIRARKDRF